MKTGRMIAATAALAIGTLVGATGPAVADGAQVPFTVSLSGRAVPDFPTAVDWVGGGQAIHMGQVTSVGHIQITGPGDSCLGGLANVNTETLTSPDGDTITLTSVDVACPIGEFKFHGTGHWTVTGGTGRFAGVTGSGTSDGEADFATGTFKAIFTGTIVK